MLQSLNLGIGQGQRIAGCIITVGFNLSFGFNIDDILLQVIKLGIAFAVICHCQVISDSLGHKVHRGSGKLRAPLGTMPPDRPVVHQAVTLIDILAVNDIRFFKEHLAAGVDDFPRIGGQRFFHGNAAAQQNGHGNDKTKYCTPFKCFKRHLHLLL